MILTGTRCAKAEGDTMAEIRFMPRGPTQSMETLCEASALDALKPPRSGRDESSRFDPKQPYRRQSGSRLPATRRRASTFGSLSAPKSRDCLIEIGNLALGSPDDRHG